MRRLWSVLPRTALSYNLGKLITRTILRPARRSCPAEVSFAGNVPMRLDLAGFVANDLYCLDDHYESVTLQLWRRLSRDSRTILDVGSHIGTFSLLAAAENRQARILAVEADPVNFELLRAHCSAWPRITPVHRAIADRGGTMTFVSPAGNDGGGYLTADPAAVGLTVTTISLGELCRQQGLREVDLMKLDIEGYEHTLLTAASDFWRDFAPRHLVVELTAPRHDRARTAELFQAMHRRGYQARRVQGLYAWPWGKPVDLANWHFWR